MNETLSSFGALGLAPPFVATLKNLAIITPTDIQAACIPQILAGKDVLASAKTGSGKTAAFALSILQHFSRDPFGTFALILTPTR